MSSSSQPPTANSTSLPPLPACMCQDEYRAADAARCRFAPKSRFPRFFSHPNLRGSASKLSFKRSQKKKDDLSPASTHNPLTETQFGSDTIHLDGSALDGEKEFKDRYEWAMLYENQRGMTIFSIPYYSSLSLLPTDPSPFTIPGSSPKRSKQPPVSLTDYPLPDGTWRWVSKCWMIDMRSDSGEVQHDGFEYNWTFRTHHWRARVGGMSAGGWVRRRRWVRLMMRPAKRKDPGGEASTCRSTPTMSSLNGLEHLEHRQSVSYSFPPSVITCGPDNYLDINMDNIWLSDDVEENWMRYRAFMKNLGRDGQKLEVWKMWLRHFHLDNNHAFEPEDKKGKRRQKQWTEDETLMPSELTVPTSPPVPSYLAPPKDCVRMVLRNHGDSILHSFIYPDSRAQFLKVLGLAGLLPELNVGLGIGWGASEIDFWSYASGLADSFEDKAALTPKFKNSETSNDKNPETNDKACSRSV